MPGMAEHRRTSHAHSVVPEDELAAISAALQRQLPATPSDRVDAAVRAAVNVLSGLDIAPYHVSVLVSRHAAAALDKSS